MFEKYDIPRTSSIKGYVYDNLVQEDPVLFEWKQHYDTIVEKGYCFVKITEGDYKGSLAKFTLDEGFQESYPFAQRTYGSGSSYNIRGCLYGRLSWKGKRNNPQFTLFGGIVLGATWEDTHLERINLKKIAKTLQEKPQYDIDNNLLCVGDKVLYLNLRYGSGGSLCHGTIKGFKAHCRDNTASVLVSNDKCEGEESECRYSANQIQKKLN